MTPDGEPFFGGTYFPRGEARHGVPRSRSVLDAVHEAWKARRDEVVQRRASAGARQPRLGPAAAARRGAAARRRSSRATGHAGGRLRPGPAGGFGGPPKFPQASEPGVPAAGGGPATGLPGPEPWWPAPSPPWPTAASTTRPAGASPATPWTSAGWSRTSRRCSTTTPSCPAVPPGGAGHGRAPLHRRRPDHPRLPAQRGLALPGGGFASAEDADSEGEEGRFYTVGWEELAAAAGPTAPLAAAVLGVTEGELRRAQRAPRGAQRRGGGVGHGRARPKWNRRWKRPSPGCACSAPAGCAVH